MHITVQPPTTPTAQFQGAENFYWQTTLARRVNCQGTGIHSGKKSLITLIPAPQDHGIVFKRLDVEKAQAYISAQWKYVSSTQLCTTLTNEAGISVSTVEHLLSALNGVGIDNVLIEVSGPEIPIMDGSAAQFLDLLDQAGLAYQETPKKVLRILKEVRIEDGKKWVKLTPSPLRTFTFDCLFDRPTALEDQHLRIELTPACYRNEVAKARTFGFIEDVEALKARGLAQGASLENAVGLSANGVMNPEGLRFDDECVRHKILDAIGDLALAGYPILGAYKGFCAGHALNAALVKAVMEDPVAFEFMTLSPLTKHRHS